MRERQHFLSIIPTNKPYFRMNHVEKRKQLHQQQWNCALQSFSWKIFISLNTWCIRNKSNQLSFNRLSSMHCNVPFQQNVSNHLLCTLNPSQFSAYVSTWTDETMEMNGAKRSIKAFSPTFGLTQNKKEKKQKKPHTALTDVALLLSCRIVQILDFISKYLIYKWKTTVEGTIYFRIPRSLLSNWFLSFAAWFIRSFICTTALCLPPVGSLVNSL